MTGLWRRGAVGATDSHPGEAVLAALACGLEADAAVGAHLSACASCAAALESLRDELAAHRDLEEADVDAYFTPGRLDRQRASVLRHITPHPAARVLAFPTRGRVMPAARRVARRWVAAAAAAGVIVGLWAGRSLHESATPAFQPLGSSVHTAAQPAEVPSEEAFLVELEVAVGNPRFEPLQPLDAMLPPILEAR